MRTLLRITADINAANHAVTEGTLPVVLKETMNKLKPEASYFYSSTISPCSSDVLPLHTSL